MWLYKICDDCKGLTDWLLPRFRYGDHDRFTRLYKLCGKCANKEIYYDPRYERDWGASILDEREYGL